MTSLKSHEHIVLDILASRILSQDILKDIKLNGNIGEYKATGNGYFLTIKHPGLPVKRVVCNEPTVIGECYGIESGFVIFIENSELTIECHGWGDTEIPSNFRELNIKIKEA